MVVRTGFEDLGQILEAGFSELVYEPVFSLFLDFRCARTSLVFVSDLASFLDVRT